MIVVTSSTSIIMKLLCIIMQTDLIKWNNLHQVQCQTIGKTKYLGVSKTKGLNSIVKIRYDYLCLLKVDLSFYKNTLFKNCTFQDYTYLINHVNAEALTTVRTIPSETNRPPAEVSTKSCKLLLVI